MRTGILVHGCNLNIENWRHVAWGDPPNQLGRIPQGVMIAHQMDAELLVFGTGASEKEFRLGQSGTEVRKLVESEYSMEYLRQYFDSLRQFEEINRRVPHAADAESWVAWRDELLSRVVLDTESQNTMGEIASAFELFQTRGIERVVLVSSPSHIVRCLRDAMDLLANDTRFQEYRFSIFACPSVTCYEGTVPADVVVVEPPHRPDRHVVPTHRRIQRMMTLQKLNNEDLVQLIEEFDDLLQRYEHKFFNEPKG